MPSTDEVYKNKTSNLDKYSKNFIIKELQNYGLYKRNPYNIKCDTLLDVACGNGVFSIEFSNFFKVKGEDLSPEAIKRANIESKNINTEYQNCDCINENSKHDIVFTRCPSFFSMNDIHSDKFQKYLKHLMERCNKIFAFGQYNQNQVTNAYKYHCKKDLNEVFSKYGTILMNKMIGNYLYVIVKVDDGSAKCSENRLLDGKS